MKKVLLLGRLPFDMPAVEEQLSAYPVQLLSGTSLEEVQAVFSTEHIEHVIMGAGLPLELRLQISQYIFTKSQTTTVHMKDRGSGREGMIPFVAALLDGLLALPS